MLSAVCTAGEQPDLWKLAKTKEHIHRFSTLITAQQVRDHLGTEDGLEAAIDWCRKTGVTKVYIETFRDGYLAPHVNLEEAKARFTAAGFDVAGCVTTTTVGKQSTGWNIILLHRSDDPGPPAGDLRVHSRSVEDYRCELMAHLSRERIRAPARRVNPQVKLIIKYPQWYDRFHERGDDVIRQTADFDRIWVVLQ